MNKRRLVVLFLHLIALVVMACSNTTLKYNSNGDVTGALATNTKLHTQVARLDTQQAIQIAALKTSVYAIFFKQGLFAGQDGVGNANFKYQRWQVPLVISAMIDVNRNYLGQFHDFLPNLAKQNQTQFTSYESMLTTLYRVNNWDTLPKDEWHNLCAYTEHCFFIDDRLWWINTMLSYAEGLIQVKPNDPQIQRLINYAYQIFIFGITKPQYVNESGTKGALSVMWYTWPYQKPEYKSTISNSLYVTAGARLAKLIKLRYGEHNSQYDYNLVLTSSQKVADGYFLKYSHKLKSQGLLLDGVGTGGVNSPRKDQVGAVVNQLFSYNQAVVLPGMAILTQLTKRAKYLNYAKNLVRATYNYSQQHNDFLDDYGYLDQGGWFADSDGVAFRLAYWQYFSLFLQNINLTARDDFTQTIQQLVVTNAHQVKICPVDLTIYGVNTQQALTYVSPNHNNLSCKTQGDLFNTYPDGYSLPGIAGALELLLLEQRLYFQNKLITK